ncbi:MAG: glycosyltransferase family 2 protein [Pseudomonadota bacterium]
MIFIILPAYNEEKHVSSLLQMIDLSLKEYSHEYKAILVDDGSTDDTVKIARSFGGLMPVAVISHDKNMGLGEAIKTGLVHVVQAAVDNDVIITMDADNTHAAGLIMRLNRNIWEGCDVVIASRYVKGAQVIGVPLSRGFLSLGANILLRVLFHIRGIRDYTCGYRAYRVSLLKKAFEKYGDIFVSESGFCCQIDILLKLRAFQPVISEVPIILRYDHRKAISKMNVKQTIKDTLKLISKQFFKTSHHSDQ